MKRLLSLVLCVCLLVSAFSVLLSVPASAVSHVQDMSYNGLDISSYTSRNKLYGSEFYEAVKRLEEVPRTFESWVYLTTSMRSATVGTIIGNYGKAGGSFSLGITKQFYPELLFYNGSAAKGSPTHKAVFNEAALTSASWNHLVVTVDEVRGELKCYVNGELKQTIKAEDTCKSTGCENGCQGLFRLEWAKRFPVHLGGTDEPQNPMFFRGYIQDTAMYSDVLTAEEVKGSYKNGVNPYDENLICYYDIDASDKGKNIVDASGNGYDLYYSQLFLTEEEMQALREEKGFAQDYAYSIAVIGDIQYMTKSNPDKLTHMYQWIVDNKESKNIQYAIGLGDITDQCQMSEWLFVQELFKIFEDAGLEYSVIRGNHDVATVGGIEESSRPTAVPEMYDRIFANSEFYVSQFEKYGGFYGTFTDEDGTEKNSVINTYRTIKWDNDDWLIVNLDFQATRRDSNIIAWANEVISSHPEHRTIIVTHEYIGAHGTPSGYGMELWSQVASKHANVELVLSGHVTYDNINVYQCKGENGNTVTQMLIDPQFIDRDLRGLGVVTMFYFREDGTVFDVEHYSTVKDRYLMNINQRTVDLRAECDYADIGWDGVTSSAPLGEGTPENPYKISSAANLLWMAEMQLVKSGDAVVAPTSLVNPFEGKFFVQTCDINLNGKTLPSIGYYFESDGVGSVFGGNYNGDGYAIINGKIENPLVGGVSVGLFGETLGALITNLSVKNMIVRANKNTGILIGRANGNDIISGVKAEGSSYFTFGEDVTEKINIGSLVGSAYGIALTGSSASVDIIAPTKAANAGGLVGKLLGECLVYDCSSDSEISVSSDSFGAIFGEGSGEITVADFKNKTDFKAYTLTADAHVHTASSFEKSGTGLHTAECLCGESITLGCINSKYGYCKHCEIDITGASVTLGEENKINYYVSIKDGNITAGKTLSMKFTLNGKTVTVDEYTERDGKLVFTLGGILAHQIGDLIDAELVLSDANGDKVIASKLDYSIKDYCVALLKKSEDAKTCELVTALLEYATKAQAHLDYNTDRFAAGGLNLSASEDTPSEDYKSEIIGNLSGDCKITGYSALLSPSLKVRIELYIKDISLALITVNRRAYDKANLISLGEDKYAIEISGFMPYDINSLIDVSVIYNGKQAVKLTFGVASHLYTMIEDLRQIEEDKANYRPSTKKVDMLEYKLFLALYRYAVASQNYLSDGEVS